MKNVLKTKNNKIVITLLLCIFSLFCLSTIAYSAFSSTMNITGVAHSRVETDVRITDFSLYEIKNATSQYEEYGKNHISTSINFKENASIIYKVEVTNYGESNIGINNITGFPENITYELIDYNLKDKICNDSLKCNNYAIKTFYIKFSANNIATEFTLNFEFRTFHNITYTNFNGNYVDGVIDDGTINIDLSYDSPKLVEINSDKYIDYQYSNNILTLSKVTCDIIVNAINITDYTFEYIGATQTFTVPYDGVYKIELWGSQGGDNATDLGGKGAYTSGTIGLVKDENLYVYVGAQPTTTSGKAPNAWSSGSYYPGNTGDGIGYGGGGSTDIRIKNGSFNDSAGLSSRIMVAAGGSGASIDEYQIPGSPGGGLIGYDGKNNTKNNGVVGTHAKGATQTSGGSEAKLTNSGTAGAFGTAGSAYSSWGTGGGGGYYGGGGGGYNTYSVHTGSSGSSYISGHTGCVAITSESSKTPKTGCTTGTTDNSCSIHYSKYNFKNTEIIDGAGYSWTNTKDSYIGMPTHDGTSTMTGNSGNGYAKVSIVRLGLEYDIVYTNIEGDYPTKVRRYDDFVVDFGENAPMLIDVLMGDVEIENYEYVNGIVTIPNVTGNIEIKPKEIIYNYEYTGNYQTFIAPYSGIYKIELWGAAGGGNTSYQGGAGAYTSGEISLTKEQKLYVYVGNKTTSYNGGAFNAGTIGSYCSSTNCTSYGYGGGGATDIRITSGSWNTSSSLKSRIMVASGGSGASTNSYKMVGSPGGGLVGYDGIYSIQNNATPGTNATGATQTSGGSAAIVDYPGTSGKFGIGGNSDSTWGTGASGGYYGGGGGGYSSYAVHTGSSGSSYISGHTGCVAITSSTSQTPKTGCTTGTSDNSCSIHYSNYQFLNTKMIDGAGYNWTTSKENKIGMPTFDGITTMIGNTGNGYAKITLLELT